MFVFVHVLNKLKYIQLGSVHKPQRKIIIISMLFKTPMRRFTNENNKNIEISLEIINLKLRAITEAITVHLTPFSTEFK